MMFSKMFGKGGGLNIVTAVEAVSSPISPSSPPPLLASDLESLYKGKHLGATGLGGIISEQERASLRFIELIETIGEPYAIPANWYPYRLPVGNLDERSHWLRSWHAREKYSHIYNFPLTLQALNIVRQVDRWHTDAVVNILDKSRLYNSRLLFPTADIFIVSASPLLGHLEDSRAPQILADPILVVSVKFKEREFTYQLTQWDLSVDYAMSRN